MTFEEYLSPLSVKPTTDLLIKKANEWQAENLKEIERLKEYLSKCNMTLSSKQVELDKAKQRITELEAFAKIGKELAEWSKKYPRDRIYGNDRMDKELILIEEKAKQLLK
jgi:hypothetical protein